MILRKYNTRDTTKMMELFYNTIHNINKKDYTKEQCKAWTDNINPKLWEERFSNSYTIVMEEYGNIVGYGNIDNNGEIDHLYVHHKYQNKGIASKIIDELEKLISKENMRYTVYASKTAKSFFLKRGYRVVRKNTVIKSNVELTNYLMEKDTEKRQLLKRDVAKEVTCHFDNDDIIIDNFTFNPVYLYPVNKWVLNSEIDFYMYDEVDYYFIKVRKNMNERVQYTSVNNLTYVVIETDLSINDGLEKIIEILKQTDYRKLSKERRLILLKGETI